METEEINNQTTETTTETTNQTQTMETTNYHSDLGWKIAKAEADIKEALLEGFCETEKSVGDAECSIIKTVGDAECSINKNVDEAESRIVDRLGTYAYDAAKDRSDIAQRYSAQLNAVERDLQNRVHENRQVLTKEIADKADRTTDLLRGDVIDVKNQLRSFETSAAKSFCDLETQGLKNTTKILEKLAADKYDALKDELDEERSKRHFDRYASNFNLQAQEMNYLKNMLNSVEQNQRFSSKTVQFGAGNVAIPTQTANQA
jgi:hypothetical protein